MVDRFPKLVGIIEEEHGGFTLTIFLLKSSRFGDDRVIDQPSVTIDEARGIISLAARELSISEDDVVIHIGLTDTRPSKGPAN
jgi:hypothetical protein